MGKHRLTVIGSGGLLGLWADFVSETVGSRLFGAAPTAEQVSPRQLDLLRRFQHRRRGPTGILLFLISLLVFIASFFVVLNIGWLPGVLIVMVPMLAVATWSLIEYAVTRRRLIKTLRWRDRLMFCPRCGYDVSKTDVHHCPECGEGVYRF